MTVVGVLYQRMHMQKHHHNVGDSRQMYMLLMQTSSLSK